MTSLYSKICDHLMTRDRGAIYKLKPRLFIKSYFALISFIFCWSLLLEFILLLSNIPLWHSTLFYSGEYHHILLCSFALSVIPSLTSTNASGFVTGTVLSQKDMQTNLWYLVAFFSKLLDIHKRNYEIYNKELLAVIWGLGI